MSTITEHDEHEQRLRDAVIERFQRVSTASWGGWLLDPLGQSDPDAFAALDRLIEYVTAKAVAEATAGHPWCAKCVKANRAAAAVLTQLQTEAIT